jgi:hypothetical protein
VHRDQARGRSWSGSWRLTASDGAPPVDRIDGDRLCELLKRYDLGVKTANPAVEDVTIDLAFFAEI